jgi:hypothetical protein
MSSTRNAQGAKGAGIVAAAVLMTMSVGSASAATPPPAIDPTVNLDPAVSLNAAAAPVAALQPALWRDAPAIAQSAPVRASRAVALRPTRAVVQAKFTVFTTSSPATKDMRGVEASLYKGAYYNTSVESVRLCIVRRESEGHYDVVNPSGSYRGAYQVSPQLARGATWMMLKEHRALMGTTNAERVLAHLRTMPVNRWPRYWQDALFHTVASWDHPGSGLRHWAGGRWHC